MSKRVVMIIGAIVIVGIAVILFFGNGSVSLFFAFQANPNKAEKNIDIPISSSSPSAKSESKENASSASQGTIKENEKGDAKATGVSVDTYVSLMGMPKELLTSLMTEEAKPVEQDGLEFPTNKIRIWFEKSGEQQISNKIAMLSPDVDYNGVKIGDNISEFKRVLGKTTLENKESAFANFTYKEMVLNINYDPKTGKTTSGNLFKHWK
ncbi:MAG: hypothetical protein H7Y41_02940 [Hyphomonadaceae bacterium]|nr:hypothetical protein [Clostridia bacterium]